MALAEGLQNAHENGAIEGPQGHLKSAIRDALLLRGTRQFATLEEYRGFIDEIVSRKNARNGKRIEAERADLHRRGHSAHRGTEPGLSEHLLVTR